MKTKTITRAEPDKMSGSLNSMDNEALASQFLRQYKAIGKRLTVLRPFYVELRNRFFNLSKGGSIMGCKTWTEFCEKHLKYSDRHVRRLIEGDNPATEKHGTKQKPVALPKPSQSLPTMPSARNADWTDNTYIKTCVQFVASTLKPLESDPQRFAQVAAAIAAGIVGDLANDDSDSFAETELAAVTQ